MKRYRVVGLAGVALAAGALVMLDPEAVQSERQTAKGPKKLPPRFDGKLKPVAGRADVFEVTAPLTFKQGVTFATDQALPKSLAEAIEDLSAGPGPKPAAPTPSGKKPKGAAL